MKYLLLALLLTACDSNIIEVPKGPVAGICAPGAHYVCPCCSETWQSDWKSGLQYCRADLTVSSCDCSDGCDAGTDAD